MPSRLFHLQNLGYSGVNIPIGSIVSAAFVSPGGIAGTTGITGAQGIQGSPGVTGATGSQGSPGTTGFTGAPGINAYSTTNGFTQPSVGVAIPIQVPSGYWIQQGQYVYIPSGGYYVVASGSVPTFSIQNLGYSSVNIPVGSIVSAAFISPGGIAGTTGVTGAQGIQGSPGVTGATGSQGSPGITGATGSAGINAYSTTQGFTQPAVGAAIPIQVPSGQWMQVGQYVFIPSGGYYTVASGSVPTFSLNNLGYSGVNIPIGSIVSAAFISPGGIAGTTGVTGSTGYSRFSRSYWIYRSTRFAWRNWIYWCLPGINAYSTTQGFTQPAIGVAIPIHHSLLDIGFNRVNMFIFQVVDIML